MRRCCLAAQEVFREALAAAGMQAATTAFFEDSARNCAAAKRQGLHTLLIDGATRAEEGVSLEGVDIVLPELTLAAVRQCAPHLLL